jgi:hypothetical protein
MTDEQQRLWDLLKKEFKTVDVIKAELIKRTTFPGEGGKIVQGKDSIFAVSDKQAQTVRHILEGELKAKTPVRDVNESICNACARKDICELTPESEKECSEFVDMTTPVEHTQEEAF